MRSFWSVLTVVALGLALPVAAQAGWGHLKGKIVVAGDAPAPEKLVVNKDVAVCGNKGLVDESLVVGKSGGLQNVVVCMLQSRRSPQKPDVHPDYAGQKDATLLLDNKNCRFEPHVVVMTTAQSLLVKNSDPVGHNANIQSLKNPANPNIPPNGEIELEMKTADTTPVKVVCGSHPWMQAVVLVRDEPYFAISADTGEFEIKNIPDGTWNFVFWHERGGRSKSGGYLKGLTQDGKEIESDRVGAVEVTIEDGKVTDLGTMEMKIEDLMP